MEESLARANLRVHRALDLSFLVVALPHTALVVALIAHTFLSTSLTSFGAISPPSCWRKEQSLLLADLEELHAAALLLEKNTSLLAALVVPRRV
jgi:hypothetical protein